MPARRFVLRSLLFTAGLGLLFAVCSLHYAVLSRGDNLARQLELFAATDPEVLILGDSHAAMNVDMTVLGSRYASLAYPQENWREIYLKARYALASKPGVRAIVVPIDWHMFGAYRSEDLDMTHSMRFTRAYGDLDPLYRDRLFPLRYLKSLVVYHLPLTAGPTWSNYRVLALDALEHRVGRGKADKRIVIDASGSMYYSEVKSFADLPEGSRREAARARTTEQLQAPNACTPLIHAFDEFLAFCARRNVAVIGVRYPLTTEFRDAAAAYDVTGIEAVYRSRAPKLAAVLDYSRSMDASPSLFRDEDHLTRQGSRTFTRMLRRDLDSLWSLRSAAPSRDASASTTTAPAGRG